MKTCLKCHQPNEDNVEKCVVCEESKFAFKLATDKTIDNEQINEIKQILITILKKIEIIESKNINNEVLLSVIIQELRERELSPKKNRKQLFS